MGAIATRTRGGSQASFCFVATRPGAQSLIYQAYRAPLRAQWDGSPPNHPRRHNLPSITVRCHEVIKPRVSFPGPVLRHLRGATKTPSVPLAVSRADVHTSGHPPSGALAPAVTHAAEAPSVESVWSGGWSTWGRCRIAGPPVLGEPRHLHIAGVCSTGFRLSVVPFVSACHHLMIGASGPATPHLAHRAAVSHERAGDPF